MKIIFAVTIAGMVATAVQPALAQATGTMEPLSGWGQLGVCGLLGAIHWWTIAKTIPALGKSHKDGLTDVASEVKGLRGDIATNMQQQLDVLRNKN